MLGSGESNVEGKGYDKQAKKVLEGVERIGWGYAAALAFPGSAKAVMRYLGEDVTDDCVMGISGGAFSAYWGMPWSAANVDLLIIGEQPMIRTFDALGYAHTSINRWRHEDQARMKEIFRESIIDRIDHGVPVIAKGVVGPPECCVVTGYDKGGDVLYGWSYYQGVASFYQGDPESYFIKDDWYDNCYGLILVYERKPKPSRSQVLQDTLEWAIELARVPEFMMFSGGRAERFMSGLAAYEAMTEALLRDGDFPTGNLEVLTSRCVSISNDGIPLMSEKRKSAVRFLKGMAEEGLPAADELRKASEEYELEIQILDRAATMAPYTYAPKDERLRMADPVHRRKLARLIREAKAREERAVECLERALEQLAGH